jgi:SAM-dependent methyltransferase
VQQEPKDPFSRANYRSLIAWPERIRREAPFLERVLAAAPESSLADLGCGTGEHARHFASLGWRVAGLDSSASMLEAACDTPLPPNLSFVQGDLRDADHALGARFGACICLGNTLAFLTSSEELATATAAVQRLLLPGGIFLFQILNYERLYSQQARHLPLNVNPGAGENGADLVFLRLLDLGANGRVIFMPTTLEVRPDEDSPVVLRRSARVELRAWTRAELLPALENAGFNNVECFGTLAVEVFDPASSPDLVVRALRGSNPRPPGTSGYGLVDSDRRLDR